MATKRHDIDLFELIVYGYLRMRDQGNSLPMDVQYIIYAFYPKLLPFKWNKNENENGGGYTFDGGLEAVTYEKHKYSLLQSKNIISRFIARKIKWSIKLLKIARVEKIYFQMGFFPSNKESEFQDFDEPFHRIGLQQNDFFAFEVHSGYRNFYKYGRDGNDVKFVAFEHGGKYKEGDEFSLVFDFADKTCTLMYNHVDAELVQSEILFADIPDSIVPAISCYSSGMYSPITFTCSEWEVLALY